MTIRLPKIYTVLLYNFSKDKNTVNLLVYQYSKIPNQDKAIHKGRISFTYDKKKLRPYRYEMQRGHSYKFYRDKDAIKILQNASLIIISTDDRPVNVDDYLEFFATKNIQTPKIMPVCVVCMKDKKLLTKLSKKTTYTFYGKQICKECSVTEIREEYTRKGIPLTSSSRKFYNEQLTKHNSVDAVIENLWNPLDSIKDKATSLFDIIEADKTSKPIKFEQFIKNNGLENSFDKAILNHWKKLGITEFLPVQQKSILSGLLKYQDQLVVAGTSSGKTFIGEIAGLHNWKRRNQKLIFTTPLVALSNQKYESFKKRYTALGARVSLRVGMSKIDVGKDEKIYPDGNFAASDVIVATYEALDWIFRSGQWKNIGDVGTFVVDEVQLLADEERGVVVDGLISRMKTLFPKCQIICLSATVGNSESLANELGLSLVLHDHRPIPLERHLLIANNNEERENIITELVRKENKILSSTRHHGQSLIFSNTRRRVQELASILKSTGIKASYYHAGMTYSARKKIEERFENGDLDAVTTTAALGAGADFPVSQVIFEKPAMGAKWISNAEYHQMSGRAGRLGYHDRGKSMMIVIPGEKIYTAQEKSAEQVAFDILTGPIEEIDGQMDIENEADQILAFISAAYPVNETRLKEYYQKLFYRTNSFTSLLKLLKSKGLIAFKNNQWFITALGRAISSSFLLPTFGYNIAKKTKTFDVRDVALEIAPAEQVYLSSKIHAQIERAMKTHLSRKLLSDGVLDFVTGSNLVMKKLPLYVVEKIKLWNRLFFDCGCKHNPYCIHPKIKISNLILDLRLEGLSITQITHELTQRYDIFMYLGDLLSWLDQIIHAIRSVARLAKAMKETEVINSSKALALAIESGKERYIEKTNYSKKKKNSKEVKSKRGKIKSSRRLTKNRKKSNLS